MARARQPSHSPLDVPAPSLVEALERDVRAAGAIPLTRLAAGAGLSRRGVAALHEALVRRGLERTPRTVRVPLRDQLRARLGEAPRLPLKSLARSLKGAANAAEVTRVVRELVAAGEARVVVIAGGAEVLSPRETRTLDPTQQRAVAALAETLAKTVRTARARASSGAQLALDDVHALLRETLEALPAPAPAPAPAAPQAPAPGALELVAAARAMESAPGTPVFVPALLRRFAPVALPALHEALSRAAAGGALELRPESGVSLLTPDDDALCPRTADGVPLSYVRVRS